MGSIWSLKYLVGELTLGVCTDEVASMTHGWRWRITLFLRTLLCMQNKAFIKELGFVLVLKILLLSVVWFLFFHQPKIERVRDLRPILLNKDHPA